MNHTTLNGVKTWSFDSRQALIETALKNKKILIAINAEKILHASPETIRIINNNIGYSDGVGAVWALKKKGFKNTIKIPGCEFWLSIINASYKEKTFYLVGSKKEVIEATVKKLHNEFQGIRIVKFRNGYIKSDQEKRELINDIKEKKPDIVFVAMGSPKQELLMEEMHAVHPAVYQGLGGSFDVYVGNVQRAPEWWLNNNLEWAYRLIKQPTRIKRQVHLIKFMRLLVTKKL